MRCREANSSAARRRLVGGEGIDSRLLKHLQEAKPGWLAIHARVALVCDRDANLTDSVRSATESHTSSRLRQRTASAVFVYSP